MSEFYLVRHGQASLGAQNYDKLSALGHQQAIWLGEYFKERNICFDRVLVGDMVRHQETAEGICKGLGRDISDFEVLPELNEFDFYGLIQAYLKDYPELGPLTHMESNVAGKTVTQTGSQTLTKTISKTEAKVYFRLLKKAMHAWQKDQLSQPLTESWDEFKQRVKSAMTFIHKSSINQTSSDQHRFSSEKKQRLLVVSSGGAKAMAIKHILGMEDDGVMRLNLQIKNTSVSHFRCSSEHILLSSFNHVPHLENPERQSSITYS